MEFEAEPDCIYSTKAEPLSVQNLIAFFQIFKLGRNDLENQHVY